MILVIKFFILIQFCPVAPYAVGSLHRKCRNLWQPLVACSVEKPFPDADAVDLRLEDHSTSSGFCGTRLDPNMPERLPNRMSE